MKTIRIAAILLFAAVILAPLAAFNFQPGAVSEIDNRMLAESPFAGGGATGDLTKDIESYVNDRIGFRDKMILAYTVLNDRLFHKMVHPSYVYGKDGYVFGMGLFMDSTAEYREAFADMVRQIQDYCQARGVPFLFVFEPAKPAVLTEYIPAGVNYDRSWVDELFAALDARQVRYIDNTAMLRERTLAGEVVFNKKYDANHWNDLGGYYVANAILEELKKDFPAVHVNTAEDIAVSEQLKTTLPVSEFPIHEMVPAITVNTAASPKYTAKYTDELERDPVEHRFEYFVNEPRQAEGAPRALVFQGSHMNEIGYKYMANGLGEYIFIHNYQNVIDFPYYFNIFQPECVVFEVAEVTVNNNYFNYERMCAMDLNPPLAEAEETAAERVQAALDQALSVERGDALTTVRWRTAQTPEHVWLCADREYDMRWTEDGYTAAVPTEQFDAWTGPVKIAALQGGTLTEYTE